MRGSFGKKGGCSLRQQLRWVLPNHNLLLLSDLLTTKTWFEEKILFATSS